MMSGMKSAIEIDSDGNSDSASSSSSDSPVSTLDEDDEVTEMSDKNGMMAKVVQHIMDTHQKAKDSWEGLETGLDFGFVLAFVLFVVFFIFWFMATKCCFRPTPGVAYTQIAKVDASDDVDNDLEIGNIRPDKSPRVLQLQQASPPLSREASLEIRDMNRVVREPRYTDDGSGEVSYSEDIDYGDEDDEEASDESYVNEEGITELEARRHSNRPARSPSPSATSMDYHRNIDEPSESIHQPRVKNIDKDDDDKYTKNSREHVGTRSHSSQRYPKPSLPTPPLSSGGAASLTAEETEKIAASLGITEYSGHYSTDGTPMRRIDEETRRSSPTHSLKSTVLTENSWGDDDLDLSDDED